MAKIALLITILILAFNVSARQWKDIRFGVGGDYPPFSKTEPDGSVSGFEIDLSHAICAKMKAKCTYIKLGWDAIIPALLVHKVDAIMDTVDITKQRKMKVAFTNKYLQIPARFAALKSTPYRGTNAFMKGKKIGVQRSSTMDVYVSHKFPSAKIKRYDTINQSYLDLKAGRLNYILADMSATISGLLEKKGGDQYMFVGPKLSNPKWFGEGVGIVVRKGDSDLTKQFNTAIKAVRADGSYKKIQDRYFTFDVYGDKKS